MRDGPCMCGDLYCGSCGPAQGNHLCPICKKWSFDGGCENEKACSDADAAFWENQEQIEMDEARERESQESKHCDEGYMNDTRFGEPEYF